MSAGGFAALTAIGLAGCNDEGGTPLPPGERGARRGGALTFGTSLPLATGLDPHTATATGLSIFPRVYGYLHHVDPAGERVILDHAESLEHPDDVTYVFKLKRDVRFHDVPPAFGRELTAEDIARSLIRYRDHPLVADKGFFGRGLDEVRAVDQRTLRVTTRRPNVYAAYELGSLSAGAILPVESIDAATPLDSAGAGSGPFIIAAVDPQADVRLVRNDRYVARPAYLDAMRWRIFPTDAWKLAAFAEREVDIVPARDRLEASELGGLGDDVEVTREPALSYVSFGMRTDRLPFVDARVREAVDLALDRDALIREITFGEGEVMGAVNPHMADGFWSLSREEVLASHGGDLPSSERRSRAQQLISMAGADAAAVTVQVSDAPQMLDTAALVRDQLRAVGLQVTIEPLGLVQWFANLRRGDFQATLISHRPYETPDAPLRYYHSQGPSGDANPFAFGDAAMNAAIERSWEEADRDKRREHVLQAQRLALAARPMLPLFTSAGYTAARARVRNRRPGLTGSLAHYHYLQWLNA